MDKNFKDPSPLYLNLLASPEYQGGIWADSSRQSAVIPRIYAGGQNTGASDDTLRL
jgi:hypothetical protein